MSLRFLKCQHIRKSLDFQAFREKKVRSFAGSFLLIKKKEQPDGHYPRLGIITSKKVGNAVCRNRVRRYVREIFRQHPECFEKQFDFLFIALKAVAGATFQDLEKEILEGVLHLQPELKKNQAVGFSQ